jgi:hypothetical protein
MPPIITTLGVNSFRPSGGATIPTLFDALLIGSGGHGWASSTDGGGGGGGIVSFTNVNPGDNWSVTSNESGGDGLNYDFSKQFTVAIGASGSVGNTNLRGHNVDGSFEEVHHTHAENGGNGQTSSYTYATQGGSGGGGWSGPFSYSGSSGNVGRGSTGNTYGGLSAQGNAGGNGIARFQMGSIYSWHGGGGGGGFGGAGGNATLGPWPNYIIANGYGGAQSTGSQQIWLGVSDTSNLNGQFSGGAPDHYHDYGDAFRAGCVAIRFDNTFPDPTVTGNPSFYDDTTNNKRIILWDGAGTFQWGL